MTFETVMKSGDWAQIPNCPGRYALRGVPPTFGVGDLVGDGAIVREYRSPNAKDAVFVVRLEEGGTISYHRPDGSWLHTLNTVEGFERKLRQLEIDG
jgi:hypothetical protein